MQYGFFWIARATSLSVKGVDGGWGKGGREEGQKDVGFAKCALRKDSLVVIGRACFLHRQK